MKQKLFMLLMLLVTSVAGAWADVTGSGTETDPYVVSTAQELTDNIKDGVFITLNNNITLTSKLTISANTSVTLNLNGKTLSISGVDYVITNNGTLTINGNNGTISETGSATYNAAIDNEATGILTVSDATLSASSTSKVYVFAVYNEGQNTLTNCTLSASSGYASGVRTLYNAKGKSELTGCNCSGYYAVYCGGGTTELKSGTYTGTSYSVYSKTGTTTITDGTYTGSLGSSSSYLKVQGGTFNNDPSSYVDGTSYALSTTSEGAFQVASPLTDDNAVAKVDGTNYGTLYSALYTGVNGDYTKKIDLQKDIIWTSGTAYSINAAYQITSTTSPQATLTADVQITANAGTFDCPVISKVIIRGGTFNNSLTAYSDIAGGTFKGDVNVVAGVITGGTFEGSVTGIKCVQGGTFTNDPASVLCDGYMKTQDPETKLYTVSINPENVRVNNSDGTLVGTYGSLPDAFTAATTDGDVITMLNSVQVAAQSTVSKNVTLDLNGKTITAALRAPIVLRAITLTVTDSDPNETGKITLNYSNTNANDAIFYSSSSNTAKLIINNGSFESSDYYGIASSLHEVDINGGTFTATGKYVFNKLSSGNLVGWNNGVFYNTSDHAHVCIVVGPASDNTYKLEYCTEENGYAEFDGVYYASITSAVNNAKATGGEVTVLKSSTENVTLPLNVTLKTNGLTVGKVTAGEYDKFAAYNTTTQTYACRDRQNGDEGNTFSVTSADKSKTIYYSYPLDYVSGPATVFSITCSEEGCTMTLLDDANVGKLNLKGEKFTLDLNNHNIKQNDSSTDFFDIDKYQDVASDITIIGSGTITPTGVFGFYVSNGSKLTIGEEGSTSGPVVNANYTLSGQANQPVPVSLWTDATFVMNSGELNGNVYALSGNGGEGYGNTTMIINGGKLTASGDDGGAIYHPESGTLTINGGTLTGATGVQMCAGTLTINGGTITSTGSDARESKGAGDGLIPDGAVISIVNRNYPGGTPSCATINGGQFAAATPNNVIMYYDWSNSTGEATTWSASTDPAVINGGYFSTTADKRRELQDAFVAEGNIAIANTGEYVSSETYPTFIGKPQQTQTTESYTIDDTKASTLEDTNAKKVAVETNTLVNSNVTNFVTDIRGGVKEGVIPTTSSKNYIRVKLQAAMTSTTQFGGTDETTIVRREEFDVKPVYVSVDEEGVEGTPVEIPNSDIKSGITFRLPVNKDVTAVLAHAYHITEGNDTVDLGLQPIQGDYATGKYVELTSISFSNFILELAEGVTAYYATTAGTASKVMGTDAWATFRNSYINAVGFTSPDNKSWAATQTNIVYNNGTQASPAYVCPNFVLTDLSNGDYDSKSDEELKDVINFYSPVTFTATAGSYHRSLRSGYNSACVPFALSTIDNASLLKYEYFDGTAGKVYFSEVSSIAAGEATIIQASAATDWNETFSNTEIVGTPVESTGDTFFGGVFVTTNDYKSTAGATGYYSVRPENGMFAALANYLFPLRACFHLTIPESGQTAREFSIAIIDGTATGVNSIDTESISNNSIYTIDGKRVESTNAHGMYIINGKKVIK